MQNKTIKYSDLLADWLKERGYTHCFYVAGGNIMHILASVNRHFKCVSVVHEVAAGIAAEYFNEISTDGKAFALVTAGPGLTNIVTAVAGAYLESRELLVIGGQVKTADLCRQQVRQRGIQEIDGVDIVKPITSKSVLMDSLISCEAFNRIIDAGVTGRKGPVFLEIPLDIQGAPVDVSDPICEFVPAAKQSIPPIHSAEIQRLIDDVRTAKRPFLLIGAGVARQTVEKIYDALEPMGIPLATTWNGADRVAADHPLYFGRPNTWGQRYSNLLMQQADLLIALGTRLGLQQTGFNWQEFVPNGRVVQVECDPTELSKGHPRVDCGLQGDANQVLQALAAASLGDHAEWVAFCQKVKAQLPLIEPINNTAENYLSPYDFVSRLSVHCRDTDNVIPCSSGGAFTVMMQTFAQQRGQHIVTNKGLASMGYGLSGAIGAAFAYPQRSTVLVEGDGGFAQNLQELGTVAVNKLNLKIFIFNDNGYASIRMTQRNYFNGAYIGCDQSSGLGLPDWLTLFKAFNLPCIKLDANFEQDPEFQRLFASDEPAGFVVPIDPEQTYFPKITSRVTETGSMQSNPLHQMTPDLDENLYSVVAQYLQ
ncbi:thiamine pyrophosphate-binding protein [Methylomonas sp. TEB]|uniref:thiamine pyrophosphate-binding protein n=1 Tax=Methylomonas sp. TEB TaxID=3398229 RepID=UPI0039F54DF8